ncbi:response regulator transcription factor [Bradyrhizobium sp. CB1015]|uniref:response regulator transcription factor n=1 Tax=Bradyrhizobium sp. CB1015 TaxID=2976822 RepID=UPI0021AA2F3B|nr:response regulator transcription factor [Bradyrhizobium sp. CB1015]UWU93221.1 response regulator transcription factor [Bradyrhizobium sp. CB1015]
MRRIRLVIADRRPIVLQGFATLFSTERDFEIVASCVTGADCLEAVRTLAPDVALVEDGFSDVTASGMLAAVGAENLSTRLVFYTASIARGELAAAIAAGACTAIPMREEPENLLQSLRLVAPAADRKTGNGGFGENRLAALTDQEHKIIRLVASGMSNKEIARQIKLAPGRVEARIEQISAQLGIKSRTELARFALSRLYGGVGALAALIWAALDDLRPASATAVDHADADTVMVMTADGTGAVVTIKISPQKANAASGKTAKAVRVENSLADMPTRAGKPIESRADIAGSTITVPTLNASRPGLSSAGAFMMTAVGVSIYELLGSHAQAFTAWDSPSDVFAWADANAPSELVALNNPGRPDFNGFDKLPWLNSDIHHESFAFEAARGDAMARAHEVQIIDAAAGEDGFSGSGNPHVGSGAIDTLTDNGGFERAATTGARNAEHDTVQAAAADAGDHEQSQRDLHVSEDGAAAGKHHAKQDLTGHESNHGQLHRASEDGSAAAEQHADDDVPGSQANSGQSQRDVHQTHSNGSANLHAEPSQKSGGNDQANHESGPAYTAAAPAAGDSFHFKNDMAAARDPDHLEDGYGADTAEHGLRRAGHAELALIPDADLIGPPHAEQGAVDHARGVEHHLTHDLFV